MAFYYNQYDPKSTEPYRLSRSRIDNFLKCPRSFYLQERLGIKPPSIPGFSLNNAVDELMKREFDIHRAKNQAHPLMAKYGIKAVPFAHESMDEWRDALRRGARFVHRPTNFIITGGIDDLWIDEDKNLIIVDYKATSTEKEISLDDEFKQGYKKQVEIYQWIFRQLGFKVSDTAYFVFCNGLKDKEAFDAKLEFDLSIIEHQGDDSWIEPTLMEIKKVLDSDTIPAATENCELCQYVKKAKDL